MHQKNKLNILFFSLFILFFQITSSYASRQFDGDEFYSSGDFSYDSSEDIPFVQGKPPTLSAQKVLKPRNNEEGAEAPPSLLASSSSSKRNPKARKKPKIKIFRNTFDIDYYYKLASKKKFDYWEEQKDLIWGVFKALNNDNKVIVDGETYSVKKYSPENEKWKVVANICGFTNENKKEANRLRNIFYTNLDKHDIRKRGDSTKWGSDKYKRLETLIKNGRHLTGIAKVMQACNKIIKLKATELGLEDQLKQNSTNRKAPNIYQLNKDSEEKIKYFHENGMSLTKAAEKFGLHANQANDRIGVTKQKKTITKFSWTPKLEKKLGDLIEKKKYSHSEAAQELGLTNNSVKVKYCRLNKKRSLSSAQFKKKRRKKIKK